MTTAREIMSPEAHWVEADVSVADAARRLREQGVGALPICDGNGHLQGVVTDRDITVNVVADGLDPSQMVVGELAGRGEVVTIGADDPVEEAIRTMKDHDVRRLPVIDGDQFVGMVSQADIARDLPDSRVGDLVAAISSASPNN
jgi:CBS domain-containing protein